MSMGITKLRNYINVVNNIEKNRPNFQFKISKKMTTNVETTALSQNSGRFTDIIAKINEAPESIFKTLSSILIAEKPHTISELQALRKDLKVICKKNPDAKKFIEDFRNQVVDNPEHKEFINSVGKKLNENITTFIGKITQSLALPLSQSKEYTAASTDLLAGLSDKSLRAHIRGFLNYISGTKA